jgi:hypothetical protein
MKAVGINCGHDEKMRQSRAQSKIQRVVEARCRKDGIEAMKMRPEQCVSNASVRKKRDKSTGTAR